METSLRPSTEDNEVDRPIFDTGLGVWCFSIVAVITLVVCWVVPRFKDISKDFGVRLSPVTIGVLRFSDFCVDRSWDLSGMRHVNPLGLVMVWMIAAVPPFLVPVLAPSRRGLRVSRWIAAGVLVLLIAWLSLGLMMPMVQLVHSVSAGGKKGS
jgi:hypothetical protein